MPRRAVVLLLAFLAGCSSSTTRAVRLETGQGEVRADAPPTRVDLFRLASMPTREDSSSVHGEPELLAGPG